MYKYIELEATIPEIYINVEEIYSTYAYFYSPTFEFAGECHEAWELVYTGSGESILETPEYKKILTKGQIFLHTPNEPHKIKANRKSCNMFFISFKCACPRLYEIAHKPINVPSHLKNRITDIITEGLSCLAGKNDIPWRNTQHRFADSQFIKNSIELLLIELIRNNEQTKSNPRAHESANLTEKNIVNHIITYMENNVQIKLKLQDIARNIGYSVPHICMIFKKTTGLSVMAFFTKLRIHRAKQLMAEKYMSISQISEHLNFDSVQYFSSQFKKIVGQPPSQYIEHLKSHDFQIDETETILLKQIT